jgi:aldose 1-epimerase
MSNINQYILKNQQGMRVTLLDLGATVSSILVPVKGKLTEMTLGYKNIDDYTHDEFYLGSSVGRVCNRIAQAQFSLNQQKYQLNKNSGEHCLHGGQQGFSKRTWQVNQNTLTDNYAEFFLFSADGEQGFPGELNVKIVYQLNNNNALSINFHALGKQDTVVNLCNHCYFHLGSKDIDNLYLQLQAENYLPVDDTGIPTGELRSVAESDFCFLTARSVGKQITQSNNEQIIRANNGFDHCYVSKVNSVDLSSKPNQQAVARLENRTNGITLQVFTDQKGLQLYSAQYLHGSFHPYQAVCLEAQNFPDAINQPNFISDVLRAGESYNKQVVYQFITDTEDLHFKYNIS